MNQQDTHTPRPGPAPQTQWQTAINAAAAALLLWIAQPPWCLWPVALVALTPLLRLVHHPHSLGRRDLLLVWACFAVYWLVSLQGLRHAHPAMYLCWIALAVYLAIYPLLFVFLARRLSGRGWPMIVAAPLAWTAQELLRNYLLTGISAAMLGHTMADVPEMIQIADLFGTYGVGFVVVLVNVLVFHLLLAAGRRQSWSRCGLPGLVTAVALTATIGYGRYRLEQPLGDELATFALIQRNEAVVYEQSVEREIELFQNYAGQSAEAARTSKRPIDVVVWPESMFTGGSPWMIADPDAVVPDGASMTPAEFQQAVADQRAYFRQRAQYVQDAIASASPPQPRPHLLVGCGVVHYAEEPNVYSGVVSIAADGDPGPWYGKTHLVMFGEYIPIAPYIPGLRSLIPPGMGLKTGPGGKQIAVNGTTVAPNICIETAVERVTINQLAALHRRDEMVDVVVTVTNDGWFDDSSVLEHHLRCAQLVAVGCRRPLLSAANNGPTAWIDSRGAIVQRLPSGTDGSVIATPQRDKRISLYLRIGDWPAWLCMIVGVGAAWRRPRQVKSPSTERSAQQS